MEEDVLVSGTILSLPRKWLGVTGSGENGEP